MSALKQLGFKDKKEFLSSVWIAGIATGIGFSILYVGLGLLGNKFAVPAEVLANPKVNKGAYVLSESARQLFGNFGSMFLGIMVILHSCRICYRKRWITKCYPILSTNAIIPIPNHNCISINRYC